MDVMVVLTLVVVGAVVGLLFGAILLKVSCGLAREKEPTIGQGMMIVGVTWALVFFLNLFMLMFTPGPGQPQAVGAASQEPHLGLQFISFIVGFLASTFVLASALNIDFGRAFLVQLAQLYLMIVIAAFLVGILMFAGGGEHQLASLSVAIMAGILMIPVVMSVSRKSENRTTQSQITKPAHRIAQNQKNMSEIE